MRIDPSRLLLSSGSMLALVLACGEQPADEGGETGMETGSEESETGTGEAPACEPVEVPVLDGPGAQLLELVATRDQIPGLADQPTTHGQALASLQAFDGRLHMGYGDYDENTGPIAMYAWDQALGSFLEFGVLPGEEVRDFIVAHGVVYGPALDHDGHQADGGVYRLDCGAQAWKDETPIEGAVHVYGLSYQGDTLYAGTGSVTGQPARVMASDDLGASWTEVLRRESPADAFSRFYTTAANSQLLYVGGRELPAGGPYFAWVRQADGEFEPVANPPTGALRGVTLADDLVLVERTGAPGFGSYLNSYRVEGTQVVPTDPWPDAAGELLNWVMLPATEDLPERMLILMVEDDGSVGVYRSESLLAEGWELLASLDAPEGDSYASLALLNNDLYLGTRAGSLWALRELEMPDPG